MNFACGTITRSAPLFHSWTIRGVYITIHTEFGIAISAANVFPFLKRSRIIPCPIILHGSPGSPGRYCPFACRFRADRAAITPQDQTSIHSPIESDYGFPPKQSAHNRYVPHTRTHTTDRGFDSHAYAHAHSP